jgi:hypothetical protein
MAKSHRIKGTFEENLWILVKENANLARFRKLLELRTNPDLLCRDPIERDSTLTVFDFCRQHDQKDIYQYLRRKLSPSQKEKVADWTDV